MNEINSEGGSEPTGAQNHFSSLTGPPEQIYPIITVEFKGNRRELFSNPMEFPFKVGDFAVVRVEKGEDLGRVICLLERLPENRSTPEHEVLRRATAKDLKTLAEYRAKEHDANVICKEKIAKHGLEMKLVDVEYQFDGRKLIFYFTADGRIDFRQLVKDLAATFRTRIELRQIGARDETKRFGGLGPCGRLLCCAVYLREFNPIGTQMAKDQNLPLSPSKISGCCSRLKCCLQYELGIYRDVLKELPRWDTVLETSKGPAVVEKVDVFNRFVYMRYQSGDLEKVSEDQLKSILACHYETPREAETGGAELEDEIIPNDIAGENTEVAPAPSPKPVKKQHRPDKKPKSMAKGKAGKSAQWRRRSRDKNRKNHPPRKGPQSKQ